MVGVHRTHSKFIVTTVMGAVPLALTLRTWLDHMVAVLLNSVYWYVLCCFCIQRSNSLEPVDLDKASYLSLSGLLDEQVAMFNFCSHKEFSYDLIPGTLQFSYEISKVQLKMLQMTSLGAQQTVTVHCKNLGLAADELTFQSFKRGVQFSMGTRLAPKVISDGCGVSWNAAVRILTFLYNYYITLPQALNSKETRSVFSFDTKRPVELPITDVNLWLGSQSGEAVGVELGPVCFTR